MGSFAGTGLATLTTAADGANAGKLFLCNPTASTVYAIVTGVHFMWLGSVAADTTIPSIFLQRFTFTGALAGAPITPSRVLTADAANVAELNNTAPGTPTGAATRLAERPPYSGVATPTNPSMYNPHFFDRPVILAAGEALVVRQSAAGNAAETRVAVVTYEWDEIPITSVDGLRPYFKALVR